MRRALAVGLGLAVASAAVMFACGGDDSAGGGAGTSNGTAGSGSGTAGSGSGTAGSASGTGGSLSGAGGAIDFDAAFDLDALAGLLGNYTCADLTPCCTSLAANLQMSCTAILDAKNDQACSAALTGFKAQGYCK